MNQERLVKNYARVPGIILMMMSFLVVLGWFGNLPFLTTMGQLEASMKFNTAVCFGLMGVWSLYSTKSPKLAAIAAHLLSLISLLTILEYDFNIDFHIDQLVANDPSSMQGRMSLGTAIGFLLFGVYYLTSYWNLKIKNLFGLITIALVAAVSFLSILGFLLQIDPHYRLKVISSMAFHTAVLFMVASINVGSVNPTTKEFFVGSSTGFALARVIISTYGGAIIVLGIIFNQLVDRNIIASGMAINLFIFILIGVLFVLSGWISRKYNRLYQIYEHTSQKIQNLNDELLLTVDSRTKALKNTIDQLNSTNRVAKIGGWEYDPKNGYLHLTQMTRNMFGILQGQKTPMDMMTSFFYSEEEKIKFTKAINNALSIGLGWEDEYRVKFGKQTGWIRLIGQANLEQGSCTLISGTIQDITKQKDLEIKLNSEREFLQKIIDNIPINIYIKDLESRKILINKQELAHMGNIKPEEVIGKSDFELYPQASAEKSRAEDLAVFGGKEIINKYTTLTTHDGITYKYLTSKVPLTDYEGKVMGLLGVSVDITDN